jgi:hypothetical protein
LERNAHTKEKKKEKKKQSSIISFDIFQFGIFHPREAEITIIMRASERASSDDRLLLVFLSTFSHRARVSQLLLLLLYCTFTFFVV